MKKHFLLFVTSFIIFSQTCQGMEEFKETDQFQIVSLRQENPWADQRLSPTKGETLWFEEKETWCHHPYLNGKIYSFPYSDVIEITLSPLTRLADCAIVARGLHKYNRERNPDTPQISLRTSYSKEVVAAVVQESLVLVFDHLLPQIGLDKTIKLLRDVENDAYTKGARRAYAIVTNGKKYLGPLCPVEEHCVNWSEGLQNNGYVLSGRMFNLNKPNYTQHFYKELSQNHQNETQPTACELNWSVDQNDIEPPVFSDKFGIFVRKNGAIKGGLFGKIKSKALVPNSCIEILWIDEKFRKMQLGTKLMNFALNHAKECGARVAELGTADFQAPKFYKKMGFKEVLRDPNFFKTFDKQLNNSYLFRKKL